MNESATLKRATQDTSTHRSKADGKHARKLRRMPNGLMSNYLALDSEWAAHVSSERGRDRRLSETITRSSTHYRFTPVPDE
jgi:hypothetical protein